jgi:hypothetical protein
MAGDVMIYNKLLKLKDELGKKALRDPRTAGELLVRKNFERVMHILWKRYNYGMAEAEDLIARENEEHSKAHAEEVDDMEEYRRGDFRDEIMATNVRRG